MERGLQMVGMRSVEPCRIRECTTRRVVEIYALKRTNHKVTKTEMNKTLLTSFLGALVVESFNQAYTGVPRTKFFPTVP